MERNARRQIRGVHFQNFHDEAFQLIAIARFVLGTGEQIPVTDIERIGDVNEANIVAGKKVRTARPDYQCSVVSPLDIKSRAGRRQHAQGFGQ